jgi:hypothetical protein
MDCHRDHLQVSDRSITLVFGIHEVAPTGGPTEPSGTGIPTGTCPLEVFMTRSFPRLPPQDRTAELTQTN